MEKEPEIEREESVTVNFKSETEPGKTYSGDKIPDDALCGVCERKCSEHTVEMYKACARKQRELLFRAHK